jgi:hypothetical protein
MSRVSLSALGVLVHLHVLQLCVNSSFLSFRHESVVTVREFYTACNARFRWGDRLLIYFYPTLVGHIRLNKQLIIKSFSLMLLYTHVRVYHSFNLLNSDCVHIYAINSI